MGKEIDIQVQEAQRVPNKMEAKRPMPRHIIIKKPKVKDKERSLTAAREKQRVIYKGVPLRLLTNFSKETLQASRDWQEVFKVMKSKDLQPRLLYPTKLSFRMEGEIKCFPEKHLNQIEFDRNKTETFPEKVKLKEFIITKPLLYEILKGSI